MKLITGDNLCFIEKLLMFFVARLKVLEGYGGRCGEVTLDSQETSQEELDKVSVLMALR